VFQKKREKSYRVRKVKLVGKERVSHINVPDLGKRQSILMTDDASDQPTRGGTAGPTVGKKNKKKDRQRDEATERE